MWFAACIVAVVLIGQGPVTPSTELERRVLVLVRQLDDDQPEQRQAAEAALVELGPDILALLPAGEVSATAEVRQRLARVREQLQAEHSRRAIEASRVTCDGEMSVTEALQSMEQQTGNSLVSDGPLDQRVTLHCQQLPFWEAFDQLLSQAGLRIDPFAGSGRELKVVPDPAPHSSHAVCAGLFRIEPTMVTAVRDLRDPSLATMRVRLLILWEPRTTPILVSQRLRDITALDDLGRAVEVSGRQGTLAVSVESDFPCVELELPLALPDRSARQLASLRGTFEALLPGRMERFEFGELERAAQVQQRRAGVSVTFEQSRQNGDTQEMHLRVLFADPGNALESHRGWIYKNQAYLVDSDGSQLAPGGHRVVSQTADGVGIAYLFALKRPLKDYRFVYETPSTIIRDNVSYELKGIDLP